MTGVRVHTDHGTFEYPEAEYYNNDKHSLDIKDEDGKYLATFNRGQWLHVEWIRTVKEPKFKPREWSSLSNVLYGVKVLDAAGATWRHDVEDGWEFTYSGNSWSKVEDAGYKSKDFDHCAPFVEILEDK